MAHSSSATTAAYVTLVAVSVSIGFWLGAARTEKRHSVNPASQPPENSSTKEKDGSESDGSDLSTNPAYGDVSLFRVDDFDNFKMALVVRTDLGMTSGKIAAQCSHAALACYKALRADNPTMLKKWESDGHSKVALQCKNEEELLLLQAQADSLNLCARSIQDAGRTQIAAGSRTVLGIAGPGRLIDQITGSLPLF